MKQFFKYVFATIVGMMIVSILCMFMFFGILGGIVSMSSEKSTELNPKSVYTLSIDGRIVERSEDNNPMDKVLSKLLKQSVTEIGLDDILENIKKAKNNENIVGIYLKPTSVIAGYSILKEVRDALEDFKTSGKFIVSYADLYSQKAYYLSSIADKIYINPQGMIELQGIASKTMFFKGTLDKIGVEMQIVKVGTFKSAVEPYIQTKMSDANRLQVTTYISGIWNQLVEKIAESRKTTVENINKYADEVMTLQPTEKYLEYNLVDSLAYQTDMKKVLAKMVGEDDEKDLKTVDNDDVTKITAVKNSAKDKIAVIYAVGGIDMPGESSGIDSKKLIETINEAKDDKDIKAVVLRVNSPGGSAFGSEQIWYSLTQLKSKKPLIVSMSEYAASGGYYISAPADTIVAEPNTLTGSIGIFGTIPNIDGLNKKLGLTYDGVNTNKYSDMINTNRAFKPEEKTLMQNMVNRGYELFVKRCADGRNKTTDQIKAIAEGRVWTGEDALKIGLVDMLGGLDYAVEIAAQKADIKEYKIESLPEKEDFMTSIIKDFKLSIESKLLKSKLGNENYKTLQIIENITKYNGIFMLMPYDIKTN